MRFPLVPTIIVAAAVAVMIGLGVWQLGRAKERDELRARYERNMQLPPMALPVMTAVDEELLFRRATAFCMEVTGWRRTGGKSASGQGGTRVIAQCRTGAEGPGFAADMGVSVDPKAEPGWNGGEVTGRIVPAPSEAGLWERLTRQEAPPRPMLVSEQPAPGLGRSAQPQPPAENSSRQYAFQWFFFAAAAAVIYVLALRKRQGQSSP